VYVLDVTAKKHGVPADSQASDRAYMARRSGRAFLQCSYAAQPSLYRLTCCCVLQGSGVSVKSHYYKGTFHGFLHFPVPQTGAALDAMAADLQSAFSL